MKTHVLLVPRVFPEGHKRAGEETGFAEMIQNGKKIHILMDRFETWRERIRQVKEGSAFLSIRYRTGNSEKSRQVEIKQMKAIDILYLEVRRLEWRTDCVLVASHLPHLMYRVPYRDIARNEGMTEEDFRDWYKDADPKEPLALIHLTPFRY